MTDQDNLRDRIADILEVLDGTDVDAVALAIINDLGLRIEERFVYATDLARDDEPVTDDKATRVVGKWEKQ